MATLVRVYPELADHEHLYFERLRAGDDKAFNEAYNQTRRRYFALLPRLDRVIEADPLSPPVPPEHQVSFFENDPAAPGE